MDQGPCAHFGSHGLGMLERVPHFSERYQAERRREVQCRRGVGTAEASHFPVTILADWRFLFRTIIIWDVPGKQSSCQSSQTRRKKAANGQGPAHEHRGLLLRGHDGFDGPAIERGCRTAKVTTARNLCRTQIETFRAAIRNEGPLTIGCTQKSALFDEVAEEAGRKTPITYANVRETAGWAATARVRDRRWRRCWRRRLKRCRPSPWSTWRARGSSSIYGCDDRAVEVGNLLKSQLDVTVLVRPPAKIAPQRSTQFPVVRGTVRAIKGHLGAFEVTVDDFAQPSPSSRAELSFGGSRNGAKSECDIILDVSGGSPLFPASDLRDGYLRADPDDEAAVLKAVLKARDLVGTFEKPRYVTFDDDLCAHSRSRIVGCNRCLELCPTGAITPDGNHVAIDAQICAGCGQCAAVCPTGAASYALPPADALMRSCARS